MQSLEGNELITPLNVTFEVGYTLYGGEHQKSWLLKEEVVLNLWRRVLESLIMYEHISPQSFSRFFWDLSLIFIMNSSPPRGKWVQNRWEFFISHWLFEFFWFFHDFFDFSVWFSYSVFDFFHDLELLIFFCDFLKKRTRIFQVIYSSLSSTNFKITYHMWLNDSLFLS